jgi:probable rRNA maturation factor
MPERCDVEVSYAARRPWVPRPRQFQLWTAAALEPTRTIDGSARPASVNPPSVRVVSVRVVGAAQSRTLNSRYRGKDRPTNVLSFAGAGLTPDGRLDLGELVICAPVVAREAVAQAKSAEQHWAHMTVHGVLHLLGFDHEHDRQARKMAVREIQILDRLGFSNPYG